MSGRVSEEALRRERGARISEALAVPYGENADRLREMGVDPHAVLGAILDHVAAPDAGSVQDGGLEDAARALVDGGIPWDALSGLLDDLVLSISEATAARREGIDSPHIYRALMHAQSRLFRAYMEGEKRRQALLGSVQREIDRFPDTIAATLDPSTLAKAGLAKLKGLIGAAACTYMSLNGSRRLTAQFGDLVEPGPANVSIELDDETASLIVEGGEPFWDGGEGGSRPLREWREGHGLGSVLILPIVVRGRTNAAIAVSDGPAPRRFSCEEMELAASFCSRLGVAMENAHLHDREQHKIKETVALLEIARAINSTLDLNHVLDKAAQMTVDLCGVVQCVVYLRDEEGRFSPGACSGFIDGVPWEGDSGSGFTQSSLENGIMDSLAGGRPLALSAADAAFLLPQDAMYEHGVDMVLIFPLTAREELTGVFALFYPRVEAELAREEIGLVGTIAAQASTAIENAALYEDIEKSYFSTVKALARAIEVKDPYTHGHSERVTEYALMIADAMQLDERERQKLKYAATLHDIGKIGISGRVLNKPGSLTDEEYSHVKTHCILGDSIVEPVEFLQGPRPIILHHHERYDGHGYPAGLRGTDIPLCARILSVADAFEAMRSDRPYRMALPLETAIDELKKNSGTQFDPEVVETFLSILEKRGRDPVSRR